MSILPNTSGGYLELIIGPMFSGKTSRLLEIHKKCQISNIECIIINHSSDNRYSNNATVLSHSKEKAPCILLDNLYTIVNNMSSEDKLDITKKICKSKVILINEGQFFNDIKESVMMLVEQYNKIVYVCGLDGDFKRTKFGNLLTLIPLCDKIEKLPSLCKICCNGNKAIFSHRTSKNLCQKLIGGQAEYLPLCRSCYLENNLTLHVPYIGHNNVAPSTNVININESQSFC
jgi:thymidine kinase